MLRDYPPILDELGRGAPVALKGLGGGCIADAAVAEFADGYKVFVKRMAGVPGMFESEAAGLHALAASGAIRVPQVLALSRDALVLEMIQAGPRRRDFFEDFGRRFAALHRHRGKTCGFSHDNFIGATPQPNQPLDGSWESAGEDDGSGWPAFFLERRLRFQVRLAAERGGDELLRLLGRSEKRIMEMLGCALEPPVILHGDLWGGNYIVDEAGEACLIDPAVYYGHREADLAMTRLFGGFDRSFYAAYAEAAPLAAGHEERLPIYQLYHVLNHFNLFGGGYYDQSQRILQRYAAG
ncbi:MAG: fructosamine kinase family protein [Xanthomonadales bacterium]|jgi:protein-ribulosamine 3-kinase|nr:fructosamine kinase family protein [Xanthomonadales bacterium]